MLVKRDFWRSLVQPPTERTFTTARGDQVWLQVAESRELPKTEIPHLQCPVPAVQQPPCKKNNACCPIWTVKAETLTIAPWFSNRSSSRTLISLKHFCQIWGVISGAGAFCWIIEHISHSQLDLWAHYRQFTLSCRPSAQWTTQQLAPFWKRFLVEGKENQKCKSDSSPGFSVVSLVILALLLSFLLPTVNYIAKLGR